MPANTALVIGSGPSGFTTALYLLRHGWEVTMVDFGTTHSAAKDSPLALDLTNENREKLVNIEEFGRNAGALSAKRMSDRYFFANTDEYVIHRTRNAVANISLAFGGLSNLWGGNVLPPDGGDIQDWPISPGELKPYYKPLTELMPVSADPDDAVTARFDFPCGGEPGFPLGPQALQLLADLERRRSELENQGVFFGRAKLAIDPGVQVDPERDPYPFGPLFNTAVSFHKLERYPGFRYIPNLFAEHVREGTDGSVETEGLNVSDGSNFRLSAAKVFVACGALGSSQLLARSFGLDGIPLQIKTNQNAFFPFVRLQRAKGVSRLPSNSISQLFIDIRNEATRDRFAHIETHQMGKYVTAPLAHAFGRLASLVIGLGRPLLERMTVMQAFLHSDFSDTLEVRYREQDRWKASITGVSNPMMRDSYAALLRFLTRNIALFKGMPLKPVLLIDPPGASNHLGGSFPMQEEPRHALSSDLLGRPMGCRNIHVTDSSILPSLPATTLTFSVMANAARIADRVGQQSTPSRS